MRHKKATAGTGAAAEVPTGDMREPSGGLGDLTHERNNGTKARGDDGHFLAGRLKTMTGTDLEIIPPARSEIAGADAERLPTLHTKAKSDADLVAVWIKSHADGGRGSRSRSGGSIN